MSVDSFNHGACWQDMPGLMLMQQEKVLLSRWLKNANNSCILQIGSFADAWVDQFAATVVHIVDTAHATSARSVTVKADFRDLPIQSASVDMVLIAHALTPDNLYAVLEEAHRVLKPGGQLLLLGLNSIGLWRLCALMGCHKKFFQGQTFLSARKIKNVLRQLDMRRVFFQTLCFRPPMKDKKAADQLMVIDLIGQFLFPAFGAVFMIVAQKETMGMTVIPAVQKQKQVQWTASPVRPTTRSLS